jgi:hypothetical protein
MIHGSAIDSQDLVSSPHSDTLIILDDHHRAVVTIEVPHTNAKGLCHGGTM